MSLIYSNDVYIADTARVTGDVELAPDVNIWYGAVLRGDVGKISVGEATNIQDNAVVHTDFAKCQVIGARVTVGHGAILHGLEIGDESLIGMGAILLGGSTIGKGCLIAAGALVPQGMKVPDGMLVLGVPGRILRPTTDEQRQQILAGVDEYLALARKHRPADPDATT